MVWFSALQSPWEILFQKSNEHSYKMVQNMNLLSNDAHWITRWLKQIISCTSAQNADITSTQIDTDLKRMNITYYHA